VPKWKAILGVAMAVGGLVMALNAFVSGPHAFGAGVAAVVSMCGAGALLVWAGVKVAHDSGDAVRVGFLRRLVRWGFIAIVVLLILLLSVVAFVGVQTFRNRGEAAISRMNGSELKLLSRLNQIKKGMSYDDTVSILGKPDRDASGLRPSWRVNGNPWNQVAVYFDGQGARNVRWMSIGRFGGGQGAGGRPGSTLDI